MAVYSTYSDRELLAYLKQGDHAAFKEIYERFKGPMYVHAYNKLRDTEEAKDAVQELFSILWLNKEKLEIAGDLTSYLYTAVRNRVFRTVEKKGIRSQYVTDIQTSINSENNVTDHRVRESLLSAMIEREIAALPDKMREIFIMSRKLQMSHREIAEELGIAEPTVKKQVNNALKILRVKLGILTYLLMLLK